MQYIFMKVVKRREMEMLINNPIQVRSDHEQAMEELISGLFEKGEITEFGFKVCKAEISIRALSN